MAVTCRWPSVSPLVWPQPAGSSIGSSPLPPLPKYCPAANSIAFVSSAAAVAMTDAHGKSGHPRHGSCMQSRHLPSRDPAALSGPIISPKDVEAFSLKSSLLLWGVREGPASQQLPEPHVSVLHNNVHASMCRLRDARTASAWPWAARAPAPGRPQRHREQGICANQTRGHLNT